MDLIFIFTFYRSKKCSLKSPESRVFAPNMSLEIHHNSLSRENDIKSWFNLNSKTGSLKLTKYGFEKLTHGNCKYYQKIKKIRQMDFILTIANLDDYLKLEGQVVLNSTQKFSKVDFQMEFVNLNIFTLNSLKKVIMYMKDTGCSD